MYIAIFVTIILFSLIVIEIFTKKNHPEVMYFDSLITILLYSMSIETLKLHNTHKIYTLL